MLFWQLEFNWSAKPWMPPSWWVYNVLGEDTKMEILVEDTSDHH
jgi:hypothetical protein